MFWRAAQLCVLVMCTLLPAPSLAQDQLRVQSPVLIIESNRLYLESEFGRRIAAEIDAANQALIAENQTLEAELSEEEQLLTDQRADMEPAEFRDLADAFDKKVKRIRAEQEAKARAISGRQEAARSDFLAVAAPVLQGMMAEANAAVLLERSSVFFSLNAIDITNAAIGQINARIGDGAQTPSPSPDTGE